MAEQTFISQDANLVGADDATTQISQDANLVGADNATAQISQDANLVGANNATAFISQFAGAVGVNNAAGQISQFCLLVSTGPLVPPPAAVRTFRFDAGNRSHYWLALQPSDSGDELRSKVLKAGRATAKATNASFLFYRWDVGEEINVSDVKQGLNAATRPQRIPNVAHVTQSARKQINVPNACLHTMRYQGTWEGDVTKDRVDELVYEVARQGVRR